MPSEKAIMFGDSNCKFCLLQIKLLENHFGKGVKNKVVNYYNLQVYPAPSFIVNRSGEVQTPTWLLPNNKLHFGIIKDPKMFESITKKSSFGKKKRTVKRKVAVKRRTPIKRKAPVLVCKNGVCPLRKSKFGECLQSSSVPQIDSLVQCGKNFPNGKGFDVPNSWSNTIKQKWGDDNYLTSGSLGRELGPGNTGSAFSNNYFNDIRMARPNDDLGSALNLNRSCNIYKAANDNLKSPGLIYNSKNPQIVGFGRRKRSNFGTSYLYSQMGPAYGSQYLMGKNTINKLGGGGGQNEGTRPQKVQNPSTFIGQAKEYNPINKFGKKKKKSKVSLNGKKVGEGSTISIKKGKIIVR
jgi:hypothetical protein